MVVSHDSSYLVSGMRRFVVCWLVGWLLGACCESRPPGDDVRPPSFVHYDQYGETNRFAECGRGEGRGRSGGRRAGRAAPKGCTGGAEILQPPLIYLK